MRITVLMTMGVERPSGQRYFNIARGLVQRGHQVRLLALHPDYDSCRVRRFRQEGVEVWYVGQMHARKQGTNPGRFGPLALLKVLIRSTLGMLWGVLCSPADVYHLGKPQPINGMASLLGVVLRGKPLFVDCDDDEVASNRLTAAWQRWVFGFWQDLMPRIARGVTVNTGFLAERMRRQGIRRVAYVPNGVRLDRFHPPSERQLRGLRAALGLEGKTVIGYVGSLSLQNHPVDLLLDAVALLVGAHPNLVLLLIGGGEDFRQLQEQARQLGIQDRVYFTGHVPLESVPTYLALADLSADPVQDDAAARARSPLKIFESMALGVPVVTADVGDRAALLDQGQAGVLVEAGSPTALAQGIVSLLDDREQLQRIAAAGRQHVQHYDWSVLAERWETIYRYDD